MASKSNIELWKRRLKKNGGSFEMCFLPKLKLYEDYFHPNVFTETRWKSKIKFEILTSAI